MIFTITLGYWSKLVNFSGCNSRLQYLLLLMPPGAISRKIQVVLFFSFQSLQAVIGCSGSLDVFAFASQFKSEIQAMFCVRILCLLLAKCLYSFPYGSDFCLNGSLFTFKVTSLLCDVTQGKSKSLFENIISYQTSCWGMSTLVQCQFCFLLIRNIHYTKEVQ